MFKQAYSFVYIPEKVGGVIPEIRQLPPRFWAKMGVYGQGLMFRQIMFYVTIRVSTKRVNVIFNTY